MILATAAVTHTVCVILANAPFTHAVCVILANAAFTHGCDCRKLVVTQVDRRIPPAKLPTNPISPVVLDKMQNDLDKLVKVHYVDAAAYQDCVRIIQMHRAPPSPFGWSLTSLGRLFGSSTSSRQRASPSAPSALPFRVHVGKYYLVNPNDDSEYPVWIAQVAAIGASALRTVHERTFLCLQRQRTRLEWSPYDTSRKSETSNHQQRQIGTLAWPKCGRLTYSFILIFA